MADDAATKPTEAQAPPAEEKPAPATAAPAAAPAAGAGETKTDSGVAKSAAKAPAAVEEDPAQKEQRIRDEARDYSRRLAKWNGQPGMANKPQRTGWTKKNPNYKPCLFGSDVTDWFLFVICFATLYAAVFFVYWGLLAFYVATVDSHFALYLNFVILAIAALTIATMVHLGNEERKVAEAEEAAMEAELAERAINASKAN